MVQVVIHPPKPPVLSLTQTAYSTALPQVYPHLSSSNSTKLVRPPVLLLLLPPPRLRPLAFARARHPSGRVLELSGGLDRLRGLPKVPPGAPKKDGRFHWWGWRGPEKKPFVGVEGNQGPKPAALILVRRLVRFVAVVPKKRCGWSWWEEDWRTRAKELKPPTLSRNYLDFNLGNWFSLTEMQTGRKFY